MYRLINDMESISGSINEKVTQLQDALLDILEPEQLIKLMSYYVNLPKSDYILYDDIINRLKDVVDTVQEEKYDFPIPQTTAQCISFLENIML